MNPDRRALALVLLRRYSDGGYTYQALADLYYLTRSTVAGMLRDVRRELRTTRAPLMVAQ